jgi:hypothetical protein
MNIGNSRTEKIPSLKREFPKTITEVYAEAVSVAEKETQLPRLTFLTSCPYSIEQLLDDEFYPAA